MRGSKLGAMCPLNLAQGGKVLKSVVQEPAWAFVRWAVCPLLPRLDVMVASRASDTGRASSIVQMDVVVAFQTTDVREYVPHALSGPDGLSKRGTQ